MTPQPSTPKSEVPDTATAIKTALAHILCEGPDGQDWQEALRDADDRFDYFMHELANTGAVILMPSEVPPWMEPVRSYKPESGVKPSAWRLSPSKGEQS